MKWIYLLQELSIQPTNKNAHLSIKIRLRLGIIKRWVGGLWARAGSRLTQRFKKFHLALVKYFAKLFFEIFESVKLQLGALFIKKTRSSLGFITYAMLTPLLLVMLVLNLRPLP